MSRRVYPPTAARRARFGAAGAAPSSRSLQHLAALLAGGACLVHRSGEFRRGCEGLWTSPSGSLEPALALLASGVAPVLLCMVLGAAVVAALESRGLFSPARSLADTGESALTPADGLLPALALAGASALALAAGFAAFDARRDGGAARLLGTTAAGSLPVVGLLLLGALWRGWRVHAAHDRRMRMTREECLDEYREASVDPEVRRRVEAGFAERG
jgi:flagellar biosynthesis protein FlhB